MSQKLMRMLSDVGRPRSLSPVLRFALAVIGVGLATLLTLLLRELAGRPIVAGSAFLAAVVLVSWYAGFGPALISVLLSICLLEFFFVAPVNSFKPFVIEDEVRAVVFLMVSLVVVGFNISMRKALADLERNKLNLQDFLDTSAIGLHWVGRDGSIVWANRAAVQMLGYAEDEYAGHHVAEFHVNQGAIRDILLRLGRGESFKDHQVQLRHRDGSVLEVLIDANVLWENGQFIYSRWFTRDVTAARRAHEALLRSEENLQREHEEVLRLYESESAARSRAEDAALRSAALQAASAALVEALTPEQVGEAILREAMPSIGAGAGRFMTLDIDQEILKSVSQQGFERDSLPDLPLASESRLTAAVRERRALFVSSPEEGERAFPSLDGTGSWPSWASLPIIARDQVVAVIGFGWTRTREFPPDDIDLIFAFGRLAAQALERAWLYATEQEMRLKAETATATLSRLQAVTAALGETMTRSQVGEVVVRETMSALGASSGVIALLDRSTAELVTGAHRGFDATVRFKPRYSLADDTPIAEGVRSGRPLFLRRPEEVARFSGQGMPLPPQEKAWAIIPIVHNDEVFGVLRMAWKEPKEFPREEAEVLETLARQTGQAFERARLYQAEQQVRRNAERSAFFLGRLHASRSALAKALTPQEVAEVIVREGVAALEGTSGSVLLLSSDGKQLKVSASIGYPEGALPGTIEVDATSVAGRTVQIRQPSFYPSAEAVREAFADSTGGIGAPGTEALAAVPMMVEGHCFGVLMVALSHARGWLAEEKDLIQAFANQGAQALDRARLYQAESEARKAAERVAERVNQIQLVTAALAEAASVKEVESVFTTRGIEAAGASTGAIYLLSDSRVHVLTQGCSGNRSIKADPGLSDFTRFSGLRESLNAGIPVFLRASDQNGAAAARTAAMSGTDCAAWALLSLAGDQDGVRAMVFGFDEDHDFGAEQKDLITTLGRQFSQALDRARLYETERELRTRLKAVVSDVPGVVWEAWGRPEVESQRIDFVSDYVEQMLGYSAEEWLSTPNFWLSIVHPDDHELTAANAAAAFDSGQPSTNQFRWRRKDGSYIDALAHSSVILDREGHPAGMRGVTLDISEQKRAQDGIEFLVRASDVLASSLDYETTLQGLANLAVPEMGDWCAIDIWEHDHLARVALVHREGEKLELAKSLEGMDQGLRQSDKARHLIQGLRPRLLRQVPDDLFDSIPDVGRREILLALAPRSAMLIPIPGHGEVFGMMTFVTAESGRVYDEKDLAVAEELGRRAATAIENARLFGESQRAQAELQRSNEAKDEFLALVSHELRTPITSIYGGARFLHLRSGRVDEQTREELILTMEQESEKLYRLVENLLALARIDLGQPIPTEPLLLGSLVEKIANAFRARQPTREICVANKADGLMATGDPAYVEQVVQNLLSNADKYSPPDKPIDVIVERRASDLLVRVQDQGPGVAPDEINLIFESFYRSSQTSRSAPGKGLGLTVCKRLVEAQGGRIRARRRSNRGLEVYFSLPLTRPPSEGLELPSDSPQESSVEPLPVRS